MKKVIVVEDNLLISVIYRHYLERLNYEVIYEVTTGEKAIELLKEKQVDLIIMDIMLDGKIDGIDAMHEIRKSSGTPVIFASGNSDTLNLTRASKITNSVFLVKPVTECDFSDTVKKVEKQHHVA
jgi:DNA-binding response OmpR family regulator